MSLRKPQNRRVFLQSLASASLILPGMLHELMAETVSPGAGATPGAASGAGLGAGAANPLAPRAPMFPARAKRVIFLYMSGGVSHVDTFDPKPKLTADNGKLYKGEFLKASPWKFHRYASCGTEVSELFPHVGAMMDDICVVRSMKNDIPNHTQAVMQIHGGSAVDPRPSIGAWSSYALGTMNQELPSYMVLAPEVPYGGASCWDSSFLPACHQGIRVIPGKEAIPNMTRSSQLEIQQMDLGLIDFFNQRNLAEHGGDKTLASRIKTFETAAGMQQEAPEVFDITRETDATLAMYGISRDTRKGFGWQCLMARRLAERGVRFVELIDTGSDKYTNWDSHLDIKMHANQARKVDQAIAGLLKDLKSRGMLQDTLVVWTTEFGRKPADASPDEAGRTHWSKVYSSWMAGGGIKGGMVHGVSDDYGYEIAEKPCDIHDFHATILNQMGLDHKKLTYRHAGRDYRLTDVSGNVIRELIA